MGSLNKQLKCVFVEDDDLIVLFFITESLPPVDVSGLVAGIVAVVVTAIIATVLGIYCYKNRGKNSRGGR